ncbi:hypothetical protein J5N97_002377 [Dioscorea zingiberensis]|uniref:Uncharacterized protein n=1 Tax=Dioscorea zingiberensis TaxID=325984 RepID=A0A9D5D240_9LILI|nr:hypothetical protein J5N97_002377 [Dioscorea zingiberensis]
MRKQRRENMEIKIPKKDKTNLPRRLQSLAPASLEIEAKNTSSLREEDAAARAPIPLLSPLVLRPSPFLLENVVRDELEEKAQKVEVGREEEFSGWRHPALAETAPVPVSLAPFLKAQRALANNGK